MSIMTSTHGQLVINGKAVRDRDAMLASIAPEFSPSTPYEAGEYVIHDGEIRKFKEGGHAAGAWSDSDNDPASLDDISNDLAAAIEEKNVIVPVGTKLSGMAALVDDIGNGGYGEQEDIIYTMFAHFSVNGNTINDNAIVKTATYDGFLRNTSATCTQSTITYNGVTIPSIDSYLSSWDWSILQKTAINDYDQICVDFIAQVPSIRASQTYVSVFDNNPFLIYFTTAYYNGSKYVGINFLTNVQGKVSLYNGAVFTNTAYDRVAFPVSSPEDAHHIAQVFRKDTSECKIYVDGVLYMSTTDMTVIQTTQIKFKVVPQSNNINISSIRIRKNCDDTNPPW